MNFCVQNNFFTQKSKFSKIKIIEYICNEFSVMEKKTPASALQELCDQEKVAKLTSEYIPQESDPNVPIFTYAVEAFGIFAKGSGRSKQLAKHDACANLISK